MGSLRNRPIAIAITAVTAVVIVLTIGLSLVGTRVFLGADILESFAPWRTAPPDAVVPTNPLVGDTVDSAMPSKATFARALDEGDIAMWQPSILGGRPLAALPNSSLLSPLNLPYWVVPLSYAPGLAKAIEIAIAIGFTALFLRRLGLSVSAGVLGGLIFAFSGFQVVWTNWAQTHIGALIAALFWAVERAIGERRLPAAIPVAIVVAIMWFEGFPSVTGYALVFAGFYALARSVSVESWMSRGRGLVVAAGGVVVGTALAAVQLLPFIDSLSRFDMGVREQSGASTLPYRVLATLIVPNAFGSHVDRNYFGPHNYVEIQTFIGVTALLLACVGVVYGLRIVRRSTYWYFVVALLAAAWIMFVGGTVLEILQQTPLFGINFIGRLRSVFGFLLAVLAAIGVEAVMRRETATRSRRDRVLLFGVAALTGSAIGFALFRAWQMAKANLELDYFWAHVAFAAGVAAFAIVLVVVASLRKSWAPKVAVVGVSILVGLEIAAFAVPLLPQIPHDEFYPETSTHEFLAAELGINRLAAAGLALYPGTTSFYGLRSVSGHAFHDPEWRDLLEAVDPNVMQISPTFSILASSVSVGRSPVLDRLAVSHLVTDPRVGIPGRRTSTSAVVHDVGDQSFELGLPVGSNPRAISVFLDTGFDPGSQPDVLSVDAVGSDGRVLAEGYRRITLPLAPGRVDVAIPEVVDDDVDTVRLTYDGDTAFDLRRDAGGAAVVEVVVADSDEMRIVFSGDTVIYARENYLPRIRWAGSAIVENDPAERIELLASGVDPNVVVLEEPGLEGSGSGATISRIDDAGDSIRVDVDAQGDGFLVVADTMQQDWHADVDGETVEVLPADHALAAVAVPKGSHTVTFSYRPAGQRSGLWISVAAIAVCVGVGAGAVVRRRRDAGRGVTMPSPSD